MDAYKVIEIQKNIYSGLRSVLKFPKNFMRLFSYIKSDSYYPEYPRKSPSQIFSDNLQYLIRNGEIDPYYFSYGLDVQNFRRPEDFISHRQFVRNRERTNQRPIKTQTGNYNYIVLLRDKYVFSSYLGNVIGEKFLPETIGLVVNGQFYDFVQKTWFGLQQLLQIGEEFVLKKNDGECADGVFLVRKKQDEFLISGKSISLNDLKDLLKNDKYLVQKKLIQHERLADFNGSSVNTIRIITVNHWNDIDIFSAFLRLGVSSHSFVDNRAKGGVAVGVDTKTGKLLKYGFQHGEFGSRSDHHPVSLIQYEDFQIPCWAEAINLVKQAHKQFPEIHSIGWDVAITPEGPVLLEGNDDWEIGGPQDSAGGLKSKWEMLV